MLYGGTASVDISPPEGMELAGYPHHPRNNTGIHDPLYASCMYLSDGETELEIICMDLVGLSRDSVGKIRSGISRRTGIPGKNIMITCSHTHSGPWTTAWLDADTQDMEMHPDQEYLASVIQAAEEIGEQAYRNRFEAELAVEKTWCGREEGIGGNRHHPQGMADPELWIAALRDMTGALRCCLAKYALHPTFIHSDSTLVSADYPGYMRSYLKEAFPDMEFLFAQGTSGNQSPRYFRTGKTFAEAERAGTTLGKAAEELLHQLCFSSSVKLQCTSAMADIPMRKLPSVEEARKHEQEKRLLWEKEKRIEDNDFNTWNAELQLLGAEFTRAFADALERGVKISVVDEIPCEVQMIALGDARIIGLPGEVFVEFGKAIQYRSGAAKCFVIELANGGLPGYACTAQNYAEGGYEAGTSMLHEDSGDMLVETAVGLLRSSR